MHTTHRNLPSVYIRKQSTNHYLAAIGKVEYPIFKINNKTQEAKCNENGTSQEVKFPHRHSDR